jgi:hypothetical protein
MKAIPARALWLLERFGIAQGNAALMGDLVEEYGSGRSALWLWRQTLLAIAAAVTREPRDRKRAILRAVALVLALNLAFSFAGLYVFNNFAPRPIRGGVGAFWYVFGFLTSCVWPAIVGWVVASTHRAHRAGAVVAYLILVTIWAAIRLCNGYEALSRSHQVGLFIGWHCLTWACALAGGLLASPRPRMREAADAGHHCL